MKIHTHAANTSGQTTTNPFSHFLSALLRSLTPLLPCPPSLFCSPKPQGSLLKVFNLPQTDGDSVVLIALPYSVPTGAMSKKGQEKRQKRNRYKMSENEREIGRNIGKESKRRRVYTAILLAILNVVCSMHTVK